VASGVVTRVSELQRLCAETKMKRNIPRQTKMYRKRMARRTNDACMSEDGLPTGNHSTQSTTARHTRYLPFHFSWT